jgi:hypothetical protein
MKVRFKRLSSNPKEIALAELIVALQAKLSNYIKIIVVKDIFQGI